jgi:hypothetical protein
MRKCEDHDCVLDAEYEVITNTEYIKLDQSVRNISDARLVFFLCRSCATDFKRAMTEEE